MAVNYTLTKAYKELKANLNDNLEARGLVEPVYADLLNRYMELWVEFHALSDDIKARGVVVMDEKRGMLVENRSLTIRHQTGTRMLDIYTALGFRDISSAPGKRTEDDEL